MKFKWVKDENTMVIASVNVQLFHLVVSHFKELLVNWEKLAEISTEKNKMQMPYSQLPKTLRKV